MSYSPAIVFISSFFLSLLSLLLLRLFGIDWDYHIDSVTYVETSHVVANSVYTGGSPFNLGYFLIVDLLGSDPSSVILFNMIAFSSTNALSSSYLSRISLSPKALSLVSLTFWFSPYRVYLSTTMLKDTFVILLVLLVYLPYLRSSKYKSFFSLVPVFSFVALIIVRLQSVSYALLSLRFKRTLKNNITLLLLSLLSFFLLQYYLGASVFTVIEGASSVDMSFREYDSVPSFTSMGIFGSFVRMLLWPFLASTGLYFFLSPSLQFLFVAAGSFLFFFSVLVFAKRYYITVFAYALLALTASVTTGFTSYVRYSLTIQCVSFLLVFSCSTDFLRSGVLSRKW